MCLLYLSHYIIVIVYYRYCKYIHLKYEKHSLCAWTLAMTCLDHFPAYIYCLLCVVFYMIISDCSDLIGMALIGSNIWILHHQEMILLKNIRRYDFIRGNVFALQLQKPKPGPISSLLLLSVDFDVGISPTLPVPHLPAHWHALYHEGNGIHLWNFEQALIKCFSRTYNCHGAS